MKYSERIKKHRIQKKISQIEIAEKIGISQAAYGKIESGYTKSISIDVGKGIANVLNIPFEELFDIKTNYTPLPIEDIELMQLTYNTLDSGSKAFRNINNNSKYISNLIAESIEKIDNESSDKTQLVDDLKIIDNYITTIRKESFNQAYKQRNILLEMTKLMSNSDKE